MRNKILATLTLLLTATCVLAQQPQKVTDKYFADPAVVINTPAFQKKHGFTDYYELKDFCQTLVRHNPSVVRQEIIGQTQRHRDIPMLVFSNGQEGHVRVLYTGCVHGDEHAGTEGLLWFMQRLTDPNDLKPLLEKVDFYIIPCVNIDGSEANTRRTANDIDLNRDQTLLTTPEARALQAVATRVMPQVYVDFHEYRSVRASYDEVGNGKVITNPHDFMLLWSNNPNVSPSVHKAVTELFAPAICTMADGEGLTHHDYYTTKSSLGKVIFNVGASSPRSSCNSLSLRGAISLLIEIRGVGLGRTSYKRRAFTAGKIAETVGRTAFDNQKRVERTFEHAVNNAHGIKVLFHSKTVEGYKLPFIDMIKNQLIEIPVTAQLTAESKTTLRRARPEAYYLDASQTKAADKLRLFGIKVEQLSAPATINAETYKVRLAEESLESVAGVWPLKVRTDVSAQQVTLPAGSYRIPMDQPLSTLVTVLLEPEMNNGFVNYRVIPATEGQTLPIYRQVKR